MNFYMHVDKNMFFCQIAVTQFVLISTQTHNLRQVRQDKQQ